MTDFVGGPGDAKVGRKAGYEYRGSFAKKRAHDFSRRDLNRRGQKNTSHCEGGIRGNRGGPERSIDDRFRGGSRRRKSRSQGRLRMPSSASGRNSTSFRSGPSGWSRSSKWRRASSGLCMIGVCPPSGHLWRAPTSIRHQSRSRPFAKGHIWPWGTASFGRPLPPKGCGPSRASLGLAQGSTVKGALGSMHWNVDHCPIAMQLKPAAVDGP